MVDKGSHVVCVYEDDQELVSRVGSFLSEGLQKGEGAIVIATPEHRERLGSMVPANQRCTMLDAKETLRRFYKGGQLDEPAFRKEVGSLLREAAKGTKGVRAYGEMVGVLGSTGDWEAAVRLERMWNGLAKSHSFALLCGYSHLSFMRAPREAARHICVEHQVTEPAALARTLGA